MSKIIAFVVGTIVLSLALLIPIYLNFQRIEIKLQGMNVLSKTSPHFWRGFVLITIVVVISIATLMGLLIFGEEDVL
jgi:hypothetical protein